MSLMKLLDDALQMSRDGDVEGAAQLLREARAQGPLPDAHLSLMFQLVSRRGLTDEAMEIATVALDGAKVAFSRSTWALPAASVTSSGARAKAPSPTSSSC